MEVEGVIHSTGKRPRQNEVEEEAVVKGGGGSLLPWQCPSSRIIRVSRISGGKDRHSKVWTAKGLRDRRVRLSVSTAIQFYDLQDRLGYDQPSKAVDWLIKAASSAIDGLPELEGSFPMPPPMLHPYRAKIPVRTALAAEQQQFSQSKSTCSSTSETSKGSVLSLSRCEGRGKARERARERAFREKEKYKDSTHQQENLNMQSSFTELLVTGGGCGGGSVAAASAAGVVDCSGGFNQKQMRLPQATLTADYFGQSGIFGHAHKVPPPAPGFSSLLHFGNNPHMGMGVMAYNAAAAAVEHQEMQQFSFMQDHVIPVAAMAHGGDYDLNVSISSGFAGFSRGTLQSNLPHHHHLVDGANLPFFFSAALPIAAAVGGSTENQYPGGFNGRLQLCCNEARRHPELKGEGKG